MNRIVGLYFLAVLSVTCCAEDLKIVERWRTPWDAGTQVTYVHGDLVRTEDCWGEIEAHSCGRLTGGWIRKGGKTIAVYLDHLGWFLPPEEAPISAGRGVIRVSIESIDTVERKEILGYIARHVKTNEKLDVSQSKCSFDELEYAYDGWYIDPPYEAAESGIDTNPSSIRAYAVGTCNDDVMFEKKGLGVGFALSQVTTLHARDVEKDWRSSFSSYIAEISRISIDPALFTVPSPRPFSEVETVRQNLRNRRESERNSSRKTPQPSP